MSLAWSATERIALKIKKNLKQSNNLATCSKNASVLRHYEDTFISLSVIFAPLLQS